ncbi:MAG: membrane protein insertion efficiency factor YidD [Oligoflexales bacterium]|nr:membrane protein insertion efficiency factor YidD [Oligoflexales bacterium]
MRKINESFICLIRAYQRFLSPLIGPRCRFYPTCSEYALICFKQYSLFCAMRKVLWRLVKCNPLHPGGVDEP